MIPFLYKFRHKNQNNRIFANVFAELAQLVERWLPKPKVAGPSPVFRSNDSPHQLRDNFFPYIMKQLRYLALAALMVLSAASCSRYRYETVAGDPMGTKIYTLDNGLKVYMSVNKDTPRIQANIAVRVGGKNDPADNTGLAHYLEHIMFKGSENFGTTDYASEKPLLDQIQALYDIYRTKTDPLEREFIYHQIDSISYEASKIAIANEYDKLMSLIGSQGSNAYTSNDVTCYIENIPSNQVENWARIQADRFKNLVVRGFHTELEAVYEEFNMGLTRDSEKALAAVDSVLFPHHPYGTQTVIGTQEHLKNPDITAILRQRANYYVPNNCAICVAGDFDPDEMVAIIEKYFGDWEPNPAIPELKIVEEEPITSPVIKHVYGNDAEFAFLTWRYPGSKFADSEMSDIVSMVLYNGMAGLLDLDINQQQKALGIFAENYTRTDHGEFIIEGMPQDGQSLDEVRDLILEEIAKLRNGDFDENLVASAISNYKLSDMRQLESNNSRASRFVESFISLHDWKDDVSHIDRISAITKDDVVAWANRYLGENSYVAAYKHIGVDPNINKIQAPKITPIETNRDKQSAFLAQFQESEVKPIEPVFVNYDKDMSRFTAKGVEVLYKKNELNGIGQLSIIFDKGVADDPALSVAFSYLDYLGTADRSAEEFAREMYSLACSYGVRVSDTRTTLSISGLDENIGKALGLVENLILNAEGDDIVLESLKADLLKQRNDSKLNMGTCYSALESYINYGPEYVKSTTMTNAQLAGITSEELLSKVREMLGYQHTILYYGPEGEDGVKNLIADSHNIGDNLIPLQRTHLKRVVSSEPKTYIVNYDARQFNYVQYTNDGTKYDPSEDANLTLFNEYFGAGMNTIVFQEMRESRALAYSARARLTIPSDSQDDYTFYAYIGSQNDKLVQAVTAFDEIINDMPQEQKNFEIAKKSLDSQLRTARVRGMSVLSSYLNDKEMGISQPRAKSIFEKLDGLTMDDLVATQQKWIKDRRYIYGIVGDVNDLDLEFLRTLGPVQILSLEEVFGY